MDTEFEVKFYPVDKEAIRKRLEEIGATLEHPERFIYRTSFAKDENPSIEVDYIRVRNEGDLIRLSAKVHASEDGKISDQKETDVEVSDYKACIEILKLAGLKVSRIQETKRETWKIDNGEVVIDSWPSLETCIEIEAESEKAVHDIAEKLGMKWDDHRITSYSTIYAEVFNVSDEEVTKRLKNLTFADPPFSNK